MPQTDQCAIQVGTAAVSVQTQNWNRATYASDMASVWNERQCFWFICLRASLEGWLTALSCLLALTVPFTANVRTSCSKPTHPKHPLTHPKPLSPHSLLQTHLPQALTPSTHPNPPSPSSHPIHPSKPILALTPSTLHPPHLTLTFPANNYPAGQSRQL